MLTDDTGILQHAVYAVPDRHHGYCTDDNARALVATVMYYDLMKDTSVLKPISTYLAFLHYAFEPRTGRFRNFMSFDRRWLEEVGSEDVHGRSLWALGMSVALAPDEATLAFATRLFCRALETAERLQAPRAWVGNTDGFRRPQAGSGKTDGGDDDSAGHDLAGRLKAGHRFAAGVGLDDFHIGRSLDLNNPGFLWRRDE